VSQPVNDRRLLRREDPVMITGSARYTPDVAVPGMLHAVFTRSTVAHANVWSVDVDAAASIPGVAAVFTAKTLAAGLVTPRLPVDDAFTRPPLAADRVRYVGEPIAIVVAETLAAALDAAELVSVEYEPLPVVLDAEEALHRDRAALFPARGSDAVVTRFGSTGDLHADADVVVAARFANQRMAVVPMEGHAVVAVPQPDGSLEVWLATQGAHPSRDGLASSLGLPKEQVRVIAPLVGGGFGAKGGWQHEHVAVAAAARRVGRPVRWVEQRTENVSTMHARDQLQYVRLGVRSDGTFTSLEAFILTDAGGYMTIGPALLPGTRRMAQGVYDIPRVEVDFAAVCTNRAPLGAFRGAGRPEATAMIERAVDLAAAELGVDPLELRLRNIISADRFPYETPTGASYDSGDYEGVLREAARLVDYDELRREQARRRAEGTTHALGIGVCCYVEITAGGRLTEYASLQAHEDGKFTLKVGTSSHGQGHETVFCALVAERLGVTLEAVSFVQADTAVVPRGDGTGGSRSGQVGGSAVGAACDVLLDRARDLAARVLEADVADIVVTGRGGLAVQGVPASSVSWAELATYARTADGTGGTAAELWAEVDFKQDGATYPFGAHIAVVEVDTETGATRLLRHVAVDDCGVLLNPVIVEGQQHGGIAAGVAQALFEEILYDDDGQPRTTTLADYAMPSAADLPPFEVHHTVTPTPRNPLGVKGIGEAGTIGATPAVQNAVVDALAHLGVRHIDMPLTPTRVWHALERARRQEPSAPVRWPAPPG
jgi:carbon-monoxide dehydrogenase large subunit